MTIAILTPTRGRPEAAFEMLDSFMEQELLDNYYLFYIDDDDPNLNEYRGLMDDCFLPNVSFVIGPPIGVGKAWNRLCQQALRIKDVEAVMMGNDDLRMRTEGWDACLWSHIENKESPELWCAWFNDGINGEKHCAFPIVPRGWVEKLDYFTPECFLFFYHDTWIFDIAMSAGLSTYVDGVEMQHKHWSKPGGLKDETTKRNRNKGQSRLDSRKFTETKRERERYASKLVEVF